MKKPALACLLTMLTAMPGFITNVSAGPDCNASVKQAANEPTATAEQLTNLLMQGRIEHALNTNPDLEGDHIYAIVDGQKATLRGSVDAPIDRQLAQETTLSVQGITAVDVELEIQPSDPVPEPTTVGLASAMDDATISAKVKMKLLVSEYLAGMSIGVSTHESVVTLTGSVSSSKEKSLAEMKTRNTAGVEGVINQLAVR